MRRSLIMGNWKMNGSGKRGCNLRNALVDGLGDVGQEVAVCVPFVYLSDIQFGFSVVGYSVRRAKCG